VCACYFVTCINATVQRPTVYGSRGAPVVHPQNFIIHGSSAVPPFSRVNESENILINGELHVHDLRACSPHRSCVPLTVIARGVAAYKAERYGCSFRPRNQLGHARERKVFDALRLHSQEAIVKLHRS